VPVRIFRSLRSFRMDLYFSQSFHAAASTYKTKDSRQASYSSCTTADLADCTSAPKPSVTGCSAWVFQPFANVRGVPPKQGEAGGAGDLPGARQDDGREAGPPCTMSVQCLVSPPSKPKTPQARQSWRLNRTCWARGRTRS